MSEVGVLMERAGEQGGYITTAQAGRLGVPRIQLSRLERAEQLERVAQGVYRTASTVADEREPILVAWLALERDVFLSERASSPADGLVVGGASAALLHGIGDLFLGDVDLFTPRLRRTVRDGVRLRTRVVDPVDVVLVRGLPTLSVTATIADLVEQRVELSHVVDAITEASGRVDGVRLARLLDPLAARNGHGDGVEFRNRLLEQAHLDSASLVAAVAASPIAPHVALDYLKGINFTNPLVAYLERVIPPLGVEAMLGQTLQNSPIMQILEGAGNSTASILAEQIDISPITRALEEMVNHPAIVAAQQISMSPAVKMLKAFEQSAADAVFRQLENSRAVELTAQTAHSAAAEMVRRIETSSSAAIARMLESSPTLGAHLDPEHLPEELERAAEVAAERVERATAYLDTADWSAADPDADDKPTPVTS